jgi:hypothetical protein
MTSGGCRSRLALDFFESALDLISTSRYNGLPIAMAATEVPGIQCVSANDLPASMNNIHYTTDFICDA